MFLPTSRCCSYPPYLAAFSSPASVRRKRSSAGEKSSSLRKLRLCRLYAIACAYSSSGRRKLGCDGTVCVLSAAQDELDCFLQHQQRHRQGDTRSPLVERDRGRAEQLLQEADPRDGD